MATKLTEYPDRWVVEQVTGPGRRRKTPRHPVVVPKGDAPLLRATLLQAAEAARIAVGVRTTTEAPVV